MVKLLILCNPLLDLSVDVDEAFLTEYQLKPGNAILADDTLHGDAFFTKIAQHPTIQYIAGGSAMNTARVCSWILQEPNQVAFVGAVGQDDYAKILKEKAQKDGVDIDGILTVTDGTCTGLCAVCVVGRERSLVARLAAANKFTFEHMQSTLVQERLTQADIVYISGFFLTVCYEGALHAAKHCMDTPGKLFCMNLSAPFLLQVPCFRAHVESLLPYCDFIFCNDDEARTLADVLGHTPESKDDIAAIAKKIVQDGVIKPTGCVVFTQGSKHVEMYSKEQGHVSVAVPHIPTEQIIDTNGAGDSFVGGFLATLLQQKKMEEEKGVKGLNLSRCATIGNYAAGVVIQHSGCAYPQHPLVPQE